MLKEIDEQPLVIRNIIQKYQDENGEIELNQDIRNAILDSLSYLHHCMWNELSCRSCWKTIYREVCKMPVEVHVASEFSYNMPLLTERPFFIYISQSGETADSRAVLVQTNEMGHKALTITNVPGSTLSREADYTLPLYAGPEIAVASTKAYSTACSTFNFSG